MKVKRTHGKIKHDVSSEWKAPNSYVNLCYKTTRTLYEVEFSVSPKYRNRGIDLYRMSGCAISEVEETGVDTKLPLIVTKFLIIFLMIYNIQHKCDDLNYRSTIC